MMTVISCPGFTVSAPDTWRDVTDSLDQERCPFTMADPAEGVGALQFSPALYRDGTLPSPTVEDLVAMLTEFAERRGLGDPIEQDSFTGELSGATASFHAGDDFVGVSYVSDGRNIMLVTYVSDRACRDVEAEIRRAIVRSIRF